MRNAFSFVPNFDYLLHMPLDLHFEICKSSMFCAIRWYPPPLPADNMLLESYAQKETVEKHIV